MTVTGAPALAKDQTEQNKAAVRRVVEEILGQGKLDLADQLSMMRQLRLLPANP